MINSAALNRNIICLQAVEVSELKALFISGTDAIKCQVITCHVRLHLVLNKQHSFMEVPTLNKYIIKYV